MKTQQQKKQIQQDVTNTLKVGNYFQLQTRSFWLGLVAILTLFMASLLFMNYYFNQKTVNGLIELNKQIIQINSQNQQSFGQKH